MAVVDCGACFQSKLKHNAEMKHLGNVLLVAAAMAGVQSAGATVLAGIYDFDGRKSTASNPELANELTSGILGWVESPAQASSGSGGDTGNIYGISGGPIAVSSGLGDGFATVRVFSPNPDNPDLTPAGSTRMTFFVQNTTSASVPLPYLFFDAAASSGQFDRFLVVDMVTSSGTTTLFGNPYGPLLPTNSQDFSDYDVPVNYLLAAGETASFVFSAAPGSAVGTTLWIDNIAVGAQIPEPSTVAIGSLLALGLCFRRRRA